MMTEVTDGQRGNQQVVSLSGRIIPAMHFSAGTQPRSAQHNTRSTNCEEELVGENNAT